MRSMNYKDIRGFLVIKKQMISKAQEFFLIKKQTTKSPY